MRPQEGMDLAHRQGIRSLGSFHGNMLTSAFGASIAASMATVIGLGRDVIAQDQDGRIFVRILNYLEPHTRLRVHWAPGIPRTLLKEGDEISGKTRGHRAPRECDAASRHCEERSRRSNPSFEFAARWIASLTLAMTLV